MPKYWCVNFADEAGLHHGMENNLWLMGYQYADDQGDSGNRKAVITMNWRRLEEVGVGDRFVAYLPGNRFFATGAVVTPRRSKTSRDRTDTIVKYLEWGRSYHRGYIYFTSSVVYENFTDECVDYPVRIDVERWENYAPEGVVLRVVNRIAVNERQKAVFAITAGDFDRIARRLAAKHGPVLKEQEAGGVELTVDDAVIDALERCHAKSQGFLLDSKLRKTLEDYAMDAAKRYFTSLEYVVEDHSKGHPYDLRCTRKRQRLYVEVKGTQTNGDGVFLTSGEVRFARENKAHMALFLLHSIKVSPDRKVLTSGQRRVIVPWDVDGGFLKPVSFKYELPTNPG